MRRTLITTGVLLALCAIFGLPVHFWAAHRAVVSGP
jgi:hypothetical protein